MHESVDLPTTSEARADLDSRLRGRALSIKRRLLAMHFRARSGHVGASLSCAEILTCIRFGWMKPGDELVLSKGHAAAALYSLLAEAGEISESEIETFYQDGTRLAAHPPPRRLAGVPFATGSLGHGPSLAAGIAWGKRLRGGAERVFCVVSDGELDEGSTWEGVLFAAHHELHTLTLLVDRNGLQGFGETESILRLEPLAAKFEAFGWRVESADGHSFPSLQDAYRRGRGARPLALLCDTVKGRGMADLEDTVACHYLPMTPAQYERTLAGLDPSRAQGYISPSCEKSLPKPS